MKAIILAAATIFAAPAALACPEGALQETVSVMVSIGQHGEGVDPADATTSIDALTASCPANPYVLKVAALTRATLAEAVSDKPARISLREHALADFEKAAALTTEATPAATVMINGMEMDLGFEDNAELRAALVDALEEER
jgi:hypothetical protein